MTRKTTVRRDPSHSAAWDTVRASAAANSESRGTRKSSSLTLFIPLARQIHGMSLRSLVQNGAPRSADSRDEPKQPKADRHPSLENLNPSARLLGEVCRAKPFRFLRSQLSPSRRFEINFKDKVHTCRVEHFRIVSICQ